MTLDTFTTRALALSRGNRHLHVFSKQVTGGNKGIGFEIVRGLCERFEGDVILTARDVVRGKEAVDALKKIGLNPEFHQLDITDDKSLSIFKDYLLEKYQGLDCLVNNAGIAFKTEAVEPFGVQAKETIRVNYLGLLETCHALFPLLRPHARVVNLSSSQGHLLKIPSEELRQRLNGADLTEEELTQLMNDFVRLAEEGKHQEAGWPNSAFAVSKVGVNALTIIQQRAFNQDMMKNLIVNSVHPGNCQTDMTNHTGTLTAAQGADAPLYLALLPADAHCPRGAYMWWNRAIVRWDEPVEEKEAEDE